VPGELPGDYALCISVCGSAHGNLQGAALQLVTFRRKLGMPDGSSTAFARGRYRRAGGARSGLHRHRLSLASFRQRSPLDTAEGDNATPWRRTFRRTSHTDASPWVCSWPWRGSSGRPRSSDRPRAPASATPPTQPLLSAPYFPQSAVAQGSAAVLTHLPCQHGIAESKQMPAPFQESVWHDSAPPLK
jgi:hypothetical protein